MKLVYDKQIEAQLSSARCPLHLEGIVAYCEVMREGNYPGLIRYLLGLAEVISKRMNWDVSVMHSQIGTPWADTSDDAHSDYDDHAQAIAAIYRLIALNLPKDK